jgi:hypothetical protein
MDFKAFYQGLLPDRREAFAKAVGSTVGYCHQIAYGNKRIELGLADAIVAASSGALQLDDLPLTARAEHQRTVRGFHEPRRKRVANANDR